MALQFIYGPACCEHEQALVAHATHWLQQNESHEVFYLVPNHVKFETEVSVLKQFRQATQSLENETVASTRLQVFSFTRLAWYFLQYTGMYPTNQLSEAGLHMLLRKILLDQKEALVAFQGEIDQPGFIGKLADLFLELQDSQIDATDLEGFQLALGQSLQEKDLSKKIADFQLLYTAYLELLNEREVGSKELITSLANYLKKQDLSHIMFIVSGFSRLTVREKELIEVLLEQAGEIKISLVMDEASVDQLPVPFDMFHDVKKMYYQLYHRARYLQVPVLRDQRLTPNNPEHSLVKLDQFWRQTQGVTPSQKQSVSVDKTQENIRIWQCESLYSEINQVATEIRKLVAEKHIRYQDIEILTRNLPLYELIIPPVFNRHQIPFYLNQNLEMKHHPFVELMDSLFLIHKRYFRYRDIMRFLRTELFIPSLEDNQLADWEKVRDDYRLAVDLTENVVLAYGYEGSDWLKEEDWVYIPYEKQGEEDDFYQTVQQVSNQVRVDLAHALSPFFAQLEQAKNGQEGASLLYHFLVEIGVEQMLRLWRDQCIEQGKLDEAKVHEQTWQAFIQLLDEYVDILGETDFDLAQFEQIILSGLEGLTYSKVPTAIDQVKVSSFDLVHSTKNKVTFVIGALDGELPKKIENKTLLSDEERLQFTETLPENKYLVKQTTVDLFKEPYIAYLAFESSEEYLYLSYPSNSEHLKDCQASPYVTRIHQQLGVPVERVEAEPNVTFAPNRISTWRQLVSDLTCVKRQAIENNQTVDMMWLALEKEAQQESSVAPIMKQVMSSLLFKNIPETLDKDLVEKIYGQNIHGSVSKFESFHLCEYRYFMTYGLKLREREVFDLTPAVTGDFYHEALDIFVKQVIGQGLALKNLDEAEIEQLTLKVLQEVFGQSKFAILEASNRMRYIKYQLGKTIREMGHILQQQSQRSGMLPAQTEVLFGQIMSEKGLNGLVFDLDQEHQLHIRGKIDRVDYLKETPPYLAVIDYKSSPHGLDYKNLYYGIAMQMITYLDVALLNAKKLLGETQVKPAGAFYLHIQNPLVDGYTQPEQQQIEKLKNFQYKGLLVEDDHLLEQLDVTLEPKESSLVYPYQMKKNATYSSKQYVKEEELDLLVKHNRRKFKEAGCAIYEGKVRLNPAYSQRKRLACEYCPFRSVCQFDVMLEENNYHRLENLSKEDVLDRLSVEEKGKNMTAHIPIKPHNSLFTDSQWQAIYDSGDNLLISASAGSGKTMVLVHRVIEKIKQGIHLDELLIVTYTEAAAKEMKERIQKAIQEAISQETDSETKQHFIEQIAKIPTANISTLHAFCLQVIRKYYYLIDIDPVFRLLTDETEMLLLEEDVWDELREELYASMQQPFYDLTENFSNDRTDRGLEQLIFTLHNFARSHPDPVAWLTSLSDLYEVPESQLLADTKIYQEVLKKTLHRTILSAANQGKLALSIVEGEEQLLKVKEMLQKEQHLMDTLLQYVETDQLDQAYEAVNSFEYDRFNGPRKNAKNEAYYDSLKDLFEQVKPIRNQNKETIQKLAETFFKASPKKLLEIMAQSKERVTTLSLVSTEFYQRFKRRKKELNLVDFNDLEHFTLDILATSGEQGLEPSEASHYYREKFSEVLVDEYQDINQLQESLLYWLRTPEPESGNLFMVGDVKQSIYSFRLADPSLFITKYQKFGENQSGRRILLQENFRSRKEVLSFTNFVFTQLMDEAVGQIAYDQSAELVNGFTEFPESDQFQVEMLLYEKGSEVTEDVADLTIDFELDDKTEGETQLVGRKIQELVTSGYLIYDKKQKEQRPVRYKDIVLLTPTKKNNLVLLDQFNQLGIPLHVNDTQNYFQATEIQTMVSLLQIIDNPYQDIPLVSVLRSPIVGLKENDLGIIRLYEKEHDFYQAVLAYLKEAEPDQPRYQKLQRFHTLFTGWRELARRNQLGQLIWQIYEDTGFLDFVAGLPAGKQRQANLHALYQRANAYEEMSFKGLFQFVRFIEKMQEKNKDLAEPTTMSEDEDAVRVMTIHASKGLEFPVVFVLDMSRQFNTRDLKTRYVLDDKLGAGIDYIDTTAREVYESLPKMALKVFKRQKLLAEEMRKLYVALTRAEQKLFLVGTVASQEKAWQRWCQVGEVHQRVLPEDTRLKCQNLLDWVGYTLVRHETADNLQQEYPVIKLADLYHYPVSFQIKFYQPQDIAKLVNSNDLDQSAVLLDRKSLDERLYQQAYKRLTYHYPYQLASQTTSYQSVSEIKRVFEDPDNVDLLSLDLQERQPRGKNRFTEDQLAVPKFLSQKKQVTAAEIGTATHLLLQQVPLDKTPDEQLFVTLAQQLIEQKIMSEEVVQQINFSQLVQFFNSEFGQFMIEHHQQIVREQPFSMLMRPENLFQDYPENEQDDVLIHGIIDGYIQLPDQLILYDYKTDFVNPSNLSENLLALKKRYQGQLYLYKQALEKATGKPVTSVRLIFLQANQALEMLT